MGNGNLHFLYDFFYPTSVPCALGISFTLRQTSCQQRARRKPHFPSGALLQDETHTAFFPGQMCGWQPYPAGSLTIRSKWKRPKNTFAFLLCHSCGAERCDALLGTLFGCADVWLWEQPESAASSFPGGKHFRSDCSQEKQCGDT